jgi:HD-GYP domain-containing protein (c-di-GMP phosphodiesterase class II)
VTRRATALQSGADRADLYEVRVSRALLLAIVGAAIPAATLFALRNNEVTWNGPAHCVLVGASAVAALTAAALLTFRGAADHDARAVIAGGAFSTMAALLAVHGLATPGVLVGGNGVVALSGGVTIPVGAALLSLLGVPSLADPRRIRAILGIQLATMVAIFAVSGLGLLFPALVPGVPAPKSLSAILLLVGGSGLLAIVGLRAARTYALSRRGADLAILVGVWWLALALVPALVMGGLYLDWWLGHGLEVMGIALVGLPVARDLRRAAPSRTLTGDLRAVELVSGCEAFMGSHLRGLLARLAEKDSSTDEHTRRVALRAVEVGEELGLAPARLRALAVGGLLHDVGKLSVPDAILKKPGTLADDEFAVIRRHPDWGHELVGRVAAYPEAVRSLVRDHHERLDGSGYPRGLVRDEISLDTRILAVCDVFDALVSDRVYRDAWTADRALSLLRSESGSSFDPICVEALARVAARAGEAGELAAAA